MALVRIEVDGTEAHVYSPYHPDRIEVIKTIPGRSWDKEGKFWTIPTYQVPSLVVALQTIGDQVQINQKPDRPPPPADSGKLRKAQEQIHALETENRRLRRDLQRAGSEASATRHNWAYDLLAKLDPEQAEKAYKRLAGVLHPDAGGPSDLMRDLNVARDLLGERSWR